MSKYYIYLISSLPMLQFGMNPPFSFAGFLEICADKIPNADMDIFKKTSIGGEHTAQETKISTLRKWQAFDTALRNELVRIRSTRRHIDPLKYLREDGYTDPSIARIAINAYRSSAILEAEKMLDEAKWQMLEALAAGHYFDLHFLIVYAHKLLILERWQKIRTADAAGLLEEVLAQ